MFSVEPQGPAQSRSMVMLADQPNGQLPELLRPAYHAPSWDGLTLREPENTPVLPAKASPHRPPIPAARATHALESWKHLIALHIPFLCVYGETASVRATDTSKHKYSPRITCIILISSSDNSNL